MQGKQEAVSENISIFIGLLSDLSTEHASFSQKLTEALSAYFGLSITAKNEERKEAEKKIIDIFTAYKSGHLMADAYYLEIVNCVFGNIFDPSKLNEKRPIDQFITEVVVQSDFQNKTVTLSLDDWSRASALLSGSKVSLESRLSQGSEEKLTEPDYRNTFELAVGLNKKMPEELLAQQTEVAYEERLALRYLGKVETSVTENKSVAALSRLLPLATARSTALQGSLLELGLCLVEEIPSQRWIIYYWLADVLRLSLGAKVEIPQSMLLRTFITLLDQLPTKDGVAKNAIFLYETKDKKELLAYFDALQAVLETAHEMGIEKIYDALKTTLTERLGLLKKRAKKEIQANPILDNQIILLEELKLDFKDDKTLGEKAKIFLSPIMQLSFASVAFGVSAAKIGVSEGSDVKAYIEAVKALAEAGKSLYTLYKLLPQPPSSWLKQYRLLQDLIYTSMVMDSPCVWYATQQHILTNMAQYHVQALIQLMSLFARICSFNPGYYRHFQSILEACLERTYHQEKLVIQATAVLCAMDFHSEASTVRTEDYKKALENIEAADYKVAFDKIKNLIVKRQLTTYQEKLVQQQALVEEQVGQYICSVMRYSAWIKNEVSDQADKEDPLLTQAVNEIQPLKGVLRQMKRNAPSGSSKSTVLPAYFVIPNIGLESKKNPPLPQAFKAFLKSEDRQVLLVTGQPCSGKESIMQWLATNCWLSEYIPVVINITRDQEIQGEHIYAALKNEYGLSKHSREALKDKKLLFIIHRVDRIAELTNVDFYRHFKFSDWQNQIKVVFCCDTDFLQKLEREYKKNWLHCFTDNKCKLERWDTELLSSKELDNPDSSISKYLLNRAYDLKDKTMYDVEKIKLYQKNILEVARNLFEGKEKITWGELVLLADIVMEKLFKDMLSSEEIFNNWQEIKRELENRTNLKKSGDRAMQKNPENPNPPASNFSLKMGDTTHLTGVIADSTRPVDNSWQTMAASLANSVLTQQPTQTNNDYTKHINALKGLGEIINNPNKSGHYEIGDKNSRTGLDLTGKVSEEKKETSSFVPSTSTST